jgi:hypothetical protein
MSYIVIYIGYEPYTDRSKLVRRIETISFGCKTIKGAWRRAKVDHEPEHKVLKVRRTKNGDLEKLDDQLKNDWLRYHKKAVSHY